MSIRSTRIRRFRVAVVVGLVFAGAGVSTAPAASPGATLDPAQSPGAWSAASPGPFAPSALLERALRPTTAGRIGRGAWWGGPVVTSTGETVTIYVSDRFNQDESIRLSWANFFAWLYHGSELSRVTIYQAPLDEVQQCAGPRPRAATARRDRFWFSRATQAWVPMQTSARYAGQTIAHLAGGNIHLTGTIPIAMNGSFSGTVNFTGGTIAGYPITSDVLTVADQFTNNTASGTFNEKLSFNLDVYQIDCITGDQTWTATRTG